MNEVQISYKMPEKKPPTNVTFVGMHVFKTFLLFVQTMKKNVNKSTEIKTKNNPKGKKYSCCIYDRIGAMEHISSSSSCHQHPHIHIDAKRKNENNRIFLHRVCCCCFLSFFFFFLFDPLASTGFVICINFIWLLFQTRCTFVFIKLYIYPY